MNVKDAYKQYRTNSVTYASKDQLLLMLLGGAVKFSKIGRQAIVDKDFHKANENIKKSQNVFYELIATLDLEMAGDWGPNIVSIYKYIINELIEANMKKDVSKMDEVIPLIEEVKATWDEAYKTSVRNK
ncbi:MULTISPECIES: flagellar export chaperone FliS [Clostridium]|uniref:flagellar export chaperone FliS n=1 Tax=Clostridium TaxID=1485 RepID=UPI0008263465|nr:MULTISPECIES: flagellar export chaperone FliS [Clostridium]PJI09827.1 flagellar export chaperone FliS [Clostridium sp. CT7]